MNPRSVITGNFRLKPISEKKRENLLNEIEKAIDAPITEGPDNYFTFSHTNWNPLVGGEKVKEIFLKFKDSIEHVRLNLWFFSKPDIQFELHDGQVIVDEGVEREGD